MLARRGMIYTVDKTTVQYRLKLTVTAVAGITQAIRDAAIAELRK